MTNSLLEPRGGVKGPPGEKSTFKIQALNVLVLDSKKALPLPTSRALDAILTEPQSIEVTEGVVLHKETSGYNLSMGSLIEFAGNYLRSI